jgi:enoyl-CoA hydratase/carnithine racemase
MTDAVASTGATLLAERRGRVLLLTISNPAARNAMSPDLYRVARTAFREVALDEGVGAVVLTGAGEHFCGGGNLNRLLAQRDLPPETQRDHLDALHDWITAMRECPQPVIAAVEGAAAGGGFSVALGCDLIVAAEDAVFVMSYVRVGLSPDGGGTDSLALALPPQAALEFLLDGTPIVPARLQQLGLVNRLVPRGAALSEALIWAERLAQGPAAAIARIKRLVYEARGRDRRMQLDAERDAFIESLYGAECGEGIAAFLQKRRPRFIA